MEGRATFFCQPLAWWCGLTLWSLGGCAAIRNSGADDSVDAAAAVDASQVMDAAVEVKKAAPDAPQDWMRAEPIDAPPAEFAVVDAALGDAACAAQSVQAERIPLDMYLMMDVSYSMTGTTAGGQTKWVAAVAAVNGFIDDPQSAGIGVGIQFFPISTAAGTDSCDVAMYTTPAVEVAPLPAPVAALKAAMRVQDPASHWRYGSGTPMGPAVAGLIMQAQSRARSNRQRRMIAVLATDGDPTTCTPVDIGPVAATVAGGFSGTPSVPTFVIGVYSANERVGNQPKLDMLAQAGGTGTAFIIDTARNVNQDFLAALNAIRAQSISCSFQVPAASTGALDYRRVNVAVTSTAGTTTTLGNVPNLTACSPTQGGWFYDVDPATGAAPQTIRLCESTCTQLQGKADKVDILLGCQTQVVIE